MYIAKINKGEKRLKINHVNNTSAIEQVIAFHEQENGKHFTFVDGVFYLDTPKEIILVCQDSSYFSIMSIIMAKFGGYK